MAENKIEKQACSICGELHDLSDLTELANGEYVCGDCRDENCSQCIDCGEWYLTDEMYETHDGDYVCETCYYNNWFTCEDCGEVYHLEDCTEVTSGKFICESCLCSNYTRCDDCGEYVPDDEITNVARHGDICDRCLEDSYDTCYDCGEWFHRDDLYWNDTVDGYLCERCLQSREADSAELHDYLYKPQAKFFTRYGVSDTAPAELTFGVELEMCDSDDGSFSNRDECVAKLHDTFDNVYCKHDGSLSIEGIEVVTHPGTLDYHTYSMRWKELCRISSKEYRYHSHDTGKCGLHIHVGRKQLGATNEERDAVAAKVVLLMFRHWDKLLTFSRRKSHEMRWCAKLDLDTSGDLTVERLLRDALRYNYGSHSDRYYAINLTNDATIEFRLFRGTLNRDTLIASLQLTNNLCKYAMSNDVETVCRSGWLDILNIEHHNELEKYCVSKGIFSDGAAADIPLLSREALAARRDAEIAMVDVHVGDRVVVVDGTGNNIFRNACPVGATGTVVLTESSDPNHNCYAADDRYTFLCGVLLDPDAPSQSDRHSLSGELPRDCQNGYYVHAHNIRRITERPDGTHSIIARCARRPAQTAEEAELAFSDAINAYREMRSRMTETPAPAACFA